jgi:hypothetical protein
MADKLMLVEHPQCGFCKAMERKLKDKIDSGEIGVIDASTKEGYDLVTKLGISSVPECLRRKDDGSYERCELDELTKV